MVQAGHAFLSDCSAGGLTLGHPEDTFRCSRPIPPSPLLPQLDRLGTPALRIYHARSTRLPGKQAQHWSAGTRLWQSCAGARCPSLGGVSVIRSTLPQGGRH